MHLCHGNVMSLLLDPSECRSPGTATPGPRTPGSTGAGPVSPILQSPAVAAERSFCSRLRLKVSRLLHPFELPMAPAAADEPILTGLSPLQPPPTPARKRRQKRRAPRAPPAPAEAPADDPGTAGCGGFLPHGAGGQQLIRSAAANGSREARGAAGVRSHSVPHALHGVVDDWDAPTDDSDSDVAGDPRSDADSVLHGSDTSDVSGSAEVPLAASAPAGAPASGAERGKLKLPASARGRRQSSSREPASERVLPTYISHAVVIGVAVYQDATIPVLPTASDDAVRVARLLGTRGIVTQCLESGAPDHALMPTRRNILNAIARAVAGVVSDPGQEGAAETLPPAVFVYVCARGGVLKGAGAKSPSSAAGSPTATPSPHGAHRADVELVCAADSRLANLPESALKMDQLAALGHAVVMVDVLPLLPLQADLKCNAFASVTGRRSVGGELSVQWPLGVQGLLTYLLVRGLEGFAAYKGQV